MTEAGNIPAKVIRKRKEADAHARRPCVAMVCAVCGQPFTVKASRADKALNCGKVCADAALSLNRQREIEREYGRPLRDILTDLYWKEAMPIRRIAPTLKASVRTVLKWFEALEIPKRTKSESVRLQWEGNQSRRRAQGAWLRKWKKDNPERAREQQIQTLLSMQQRRGGTDIERMMAEAMLAASLTFVHQYPVGGKFLCDFAFPDTKLIVECDGEYWHGRPGQAAKDKSKDAYLRACGFTVLRFKGRQILGDARGCVAEIRRALALGAA